MSLADIDDGLTEEERAALAEEEGASAEATDTDPEDTSAADTETAAATEAAASEADAAKAAAAATATTTEAAAQTETTTPTQQPILVAPSTEDADAKLADIATQKESLLAQFDDGDITTKEYQQKLDELMKAERRIEFEQHEAQLAAKMEQQRLQNEWTRTCNDFVESHPVYKDNPRLYKALDAEVRELAGKPETGNWTGQKFLDEAHKALKQAFGFQEAIAPGKKPPAAPERELPPNLAKVPAANVEDTSGGRFAVLDRLANSDPVAYEETLAKMSETERTAYLNA